MAATGIMTGLLGYSLKKEMLGDSLFYRETATFTYEIYSIASPINPLQIQSGIQNEFRAKYSGDINVRVFNQPSDYSFPNDSLRASKFNVEVQVRSVPASLSTWSSELNSSSGYRGLNEAFFVGSGKDLNDFKEDFSFETSENGVQSFGHNLSFGLRTGTKQAAASIATSIFSGDRDNSFGISNMIGSIGVIADSGTYQNYYTESYDVIRNQYSFSRKRDILPSGVSNYLFNTTHILELADDGIVRVSEKGHVQGKMSFLQAQQGGDSLLGNSYARCSGFYGIYSPLSTNLSSSLNNSPLINTPLKTVRMNNRMSMTSDYEVMYTNNPLYNANAYMQEETMEVSDLDLGIVDLKHSIEFSINRRNSTTNLSNLIDAAVIASPSRASGYFTPAVWPLKQIKKNITWPNRKTKTAKVMVEYSNNPKYFFTINGVSYRVLDYKINRTEPVDIITEYKVINRPTKLSVINYAFQTEKGEIQIVIDASIGRKSDEFATGVGFRTDLGGYIANLYNFAINLFFDDFNGQLPLAFTYYLKDVKYSYGSDTGVLQMTLVFSYSLKKYTS